MDYKLANILGTVYTKGNLVWTSDGKSVISPVGNRVNCFDIVNSRGFTFGYEHRKNVACVALNARGSLLMSVDEDGRGILANFKLRTVLHHFNFKAPVTAIQFSPDSRHIAVAVGSHIQVWRTPTAEDARQFAPFVRHRVYTGHYASVTSVEWSRDSRFFLTASNDMTAHIWSLHSSESEAASSLGGHRDAVVGAWFSADQETIYTVSRDGAEFQWQWSDEEDKWIVTGKNYFEQGRVRCAAFHPPSNLLVVGFEAGLFGLYELPHASLVQKLTVSQHAVDFVALNSTGEWLLLGASALGQLLVWEWQSESYVLKQQSHYDALTCLAYSPDGTRVVTGADDGKIKVWDTVSGFSVATLSQHTAAVTALAFTSRGVLFSASLDGSVRAWDLLRYRNFRTLTAPTRVQFTTMAVDPSGELVAAGGLNSFDVHVWNVQTSQLVDRLAGHEGPVSALAFSSADGTLASGSWDHTLRLWSLFGRGGATSEPMQLHSECLAVAFRPDGRQLAATSMDGLVSVWDPRSSEQVAEIDGRNDIGGGGRHLGDRFTSANSSRARHYTTLGWSMDGRTLLAGGNARFICLYDVENQVLLRKWTISRNMALDGTQDKLNSRNMTEAGPLDLIDTNEDQDESIPGAQRGAASVRRLRPAIRTAAVQFSPVERSFSVASTEGLQVYSADTGVAFDPVDLDIDITVDSCISLLSRHDFLAALVVAFRLGDSKLLERVFQSIPPNDIPLVVRDTPAVYVGRLLMLVARQGEQTPHIEYVLLWLRAVLEYHGRQIAADRQNLSVPLRAAQKLLLSSSQVLSTAQENVYRAQVLQKVGAGTETPESTMDSN